jgi:hypothetical protein
MTAPKAAKRPVEVWVDAVLDSDLSSTAKLVAFAVSRRMHFTTLGGSFQGAYTLAKRTGLQPRTVYKQLTVLQSRGWLEQTNKGHSEQGGKRTASTYRGTHPCYCNANDQCSQNTGHAFDQCSCVTGHVGGPVIVTTPTSDRDDTDQCSQITPSFSLPGSKTRGSEKRASARVGVGFAAAARRSRGKKKEPSDFSNVVPGVLDYDGTFTKAEYPEGSK